jgi:hypothetical protein
LPGHGLAVVDSASEYGIKFMHWVLRILPPDRVNEVGVRPAQEALLEQLRSGELFESLIEEPCAAA